MVICRNTAVTEGENGAAIQRVAKVEQSWVARPVTHQPLGETPCPGPKLV
jgi:hypothetical protein